MTRVLLFVGSVAVAVALYLVLAAQGRSDGSAGSAVSIHSALAPDSTSSVARARALQHSPAASSLPPGLSVPQLEQRAAGGDIEAGYELGWLLHVCGDFVEKDLSDVEDLAIQLAADDSEWFRQQTSAGSDVEAVERTVDQVRRHEDMCGGRALPPIEHRKERALAALDRAANSGHRQAQLVWVDAFRRRWSKREDVVHQAEQARIERDRARAYLQNALHERIVGALPHQALAYHLGDLAAVDPVAAQAHWLAWRRLERESDDTQSWVLARVDMGFSRQLNAEDAAAAERQATRLVQDFSR